MTIQKGNALLANRAGKSSALLLDPSVSQGSALQQVLPRPRGRSSHRLNQNANVVSRPLAVLIRDINRALTAGGWRAIFTGASGTNDLAKLAHHLPYWQYLADDLVHGGPKAKLAILPQARREVARWQTLAHKYSSL